jgi:V8-like Glu-specific endopeptidase
MKIRKSLLILLSTLITTAAAGVKIVPKVIYGVDDRNDIFQSNDNLLKQLSLSTAAQIPNELLVKQAENYLLNGPTLKDTGVCGSERFSNQLTSADCSGFLIGPDTLVTAGHCVQTLSDCSENFWVFDYSNFTKEKSSFIFNKTQLYRCTAIISHTFGEANKSDYSVLKLDRIVEGRIPMKFRTSGKIENSTDLAVIGHPSGLPAKITSSVNIRDNSNEIFFTTNSDTFSGNSGAAVINTKTGLVEGILVRGDLDYIQATGSSCRVSKINDTLGGRGEDVIRIGIIPNL